ncbi:MAG: hypothetical protein KDJ86_07465 [Bauldia sp.]|uniref:hypothetical protein n=1 Tax=Bauldia sp. TaxID=2575872 RepID=UPI001D804797|nr:hypothetical protein [Bauldia sp.]MCB1495605.1 hypothetical protein [Bauldia sp.]
MKLVSTSVTALAAIGIVAGASVAASACEWHKSHVTASAAPVEQEATLPASTVDPVVMAELGDEAIVPRKPEEVLDSEAQ